VNDKAKEAVTQTRLAKEAVETYQNVESIASEKIHENICQVFREFVGGINKCHDEDYFVSDGCCIRGTDESVAICDLNFIEAEKAIISFLSWVIEHSKDECEAAHRILDAFNKA